MDLIFALAGLSALMAAVLPRVVARRPVSLPLVLLGAGVLLYLLPLGLPAPDPLSHRAVVEHATEVCVVVSLMGAGLAIDRPIGRRSWSSTWRLLGITMPLTIAAVAATALVVLGWPPAAALLLGAVLAPTDPVLAADVRVGEPTDTKHDENEVRFGLTSEAGLNDGLAFPVVYAAIALTTATGMGWVAEWALVDLLYGCAVGVLGGIAVGRLLGRIFFRAPLAALQLARQREGFVALAATFISYGAVELAHGYGFLAVFAAACTIRATERAHGYHNVLHSFIEQIERLLTAWLVLFVGGFVAIGGLEALTWRGVLAGLLVLLVIRPTTGWLAQLRGRTERRQRRVIAFFGIRGIGSLFYLAYALGHADFGVAAEELWAVVAFTVLASIVVHGITASPLMERLDRARTQRSRHGRPPPEGGKGSAESH